MKGVIRCVWAAGLGMGFLVPGAGTAWGHGGFENDTEVRVYPDRVKIVVRVSEAFAWRVMGTEAPAGLDEAAKTAAAPAMARTAAGLLEFSVNGKPVTPARTEGLFEPQRDVAFVLTYPPLPAGDVRITARWFPLLGTLETGSIQVYDHTPPEARFRRDLTPVARATLDGGNSVLHLPGGLPRTTVTTATAAPDDALDDHSGGPRQAGRSWLPWAYGIAAAVGAWALRRGVGRRA